MFLSLLNSLVFTIILGAAKFVTAYAVCALQTKISAALAKSQAGEYDILTGDEQTCMVVHATPYQPLVKKNKDTLLPHRSTLGKSL